MILESYIGQSKLADYCDVAIFQPDCYSWRSKIFPAYQNKTYIHNLNKSPINCVFVKKDGLEQIDLLWLYLIKYKDKIQFYSKDYEQNLFFQYFNNKKKINEYTVSLINTVLSGCKKRNIPELSKPLHFDDNKYFSGNIEKDLSILSNLLSIPLVKIKLNYGLKYPVRNDIELFVKDFYKTYIVI